VTFDQNGSDLAMVFKKNSGEVVGESKGSVTIIEHKETRQERADTLYVMQVFFGKMNYKLRDTPTSNANHDAFCDLFTSHFFRKSSMLLAFLVRAATPLLLCSCCLPRN